MKKISYILASILEVCLLAASWHWPRLSRRSKHLSRCADVKNKKLWVFIGAMRAFLVGRFFLKDSIKPLVAKNKYLDKSLCCRKCPHVLAAA